MRLSSAFAAGVELSEVAKAKLTVMTRDGEWTTGEVAEVGLGEVVEDDLDLGEALAIGLSITNDLHADVVEHIEAKRSGTACLLRSSTRKRAPRAATSRAHGSV